MAGERLVNRIRTTSEVLILSAIDLAALLLIFRLSVLVRTHVLPSIYPNFPVNPPFKNVANLFWVLLVWLFFFYYENLYTRWFSLWDEIGALIKASFLSTATTFVIISMGKLSDEISRTLVVVMGAITILLVPPVRMLSKGLLRKLGFFTRRVLILGASDSGMRVARALRRDPNYGYTVIGFLDDDPEKIGTRIDGVKVHKGIDNVLAYATRSNVKDLFIALPDGERDRIGTLIDNLQHKFDQVLFVPDMSGVFATETTLVHFFHEQVFALKVRNNLSRPFNIAVKRCFDILASSLLMIVLSIPLLILAALIKLRLGGPVFFRQTRIGRSGKPFGCLKFRTMHGDADEQLRALLATDAEARREWGTYRKLRNDPRVTTFGEFLRSMSLDELPQLFNVLVGEMSLVGPRPVLQEEIDLYYKDKAEFCFSVRPGVTGLWQVSGRSGNGYDYRIAADLWYVKNWNLWLDIVILLRTVPALLSRAGAY
jgi:Undecaprenyl-phosphate galactose phosphotransferase WbaP